MKKKNKNSEIKPLIISLVIIFLLLIISVIFMPIYELKLIAFGVFLVAIIILIVKIHEKVKYSNISISDLEPKSDSDIKMEIMEDQYATRFAVTGTSTGTSEEGHSFKMVEMEEGDLVLDKEQNDVKQPTTNSNNFYIENYTNNEAISDANATKQQSEPFNNPANVENKNVDVIDNIEDEIITNTPKDEATESIEQNVFNINSKTEPYKKIIINKPFNIEENINLNLKSKRNSFLYFIEKFFNIIRAKLNDVNTLAFVWVNYDSKTLDFAYLSSNDPNTKTSLITEQKQIPFGNDLISQIVQKKSPINPEIITEILDPSKELSYFSYYTKPVGTNSFICIPIYFKNNIIAVLCADSKKSNALKENECSFLEKITFPITGLIYIFNNIIRQDKAKQSMELIAGFNKIISLHGTTFKNICNTITEYIFNIYSCTSIGIVSYNHKTKNGNIISYRTTENIDKELLINEDINMDSTIIGECINTNKIIRVANIPAEFVRVNKYEPTINNGTFVAVPIYTITDKYAIFVEFKNDPSVVATIDVNMLETVCEEAGKVLEKINFMDLLPIEIRTGILSKTTFEKRLLEEFNKAIDNDYKITLALISLDKYAAIENTNVKNQIFNKIIETIKSNIKQYEVIGRVNNNVLGVILYNKSISQSKIILEKIKNQLAKNSIKVNNENFIFSVSIGAGNIDNKNTFSDFTSNVTVALRKAEERNNYVQTFE